MGLIKGVFKVIGSTVLTVTGTASGILKGVSDANGFELGSDIFGAAKDASFGGIKSMWTGESSDKFSDKMDTAAEKFGQNKMADTAKRAAEIAKKNGDMEKYDHYMEKYNEYKQNIQEVFEFLFRLG